MWLDNHFGPHDYGVEFPDGSIYDPRKIQLETAVAVPGCAETKSQCLCGNSGELTEEQYQELNDMGKKAVEVLREDGKLPPKSEAPATPKASDLLNIISEKEEHIGFLNKQLRDKYKPEYMIVEECGGNLIRKQILKIEDSQEGFIRITISK